MLIKLLKALELLKSFFDIPLSSIQKILSFPIEGNVFLSKRNTQIRKKTSRCKNVFLINQCAIHCKTGRNIA